MMDDEGPARTMQMHKSDWSGVLVVNVSSGIDDRTNIVGTGGGCGGSYVVVTKWMRVVSTGIGIQVGVTWDRYIIVVKVVKVMNVSRSIDYRAVVADMIDSEGDSDVVVPMLTSWTLQKLGLEK